MNPTKFQSKVQQALRKGKSLLLLAPTGLGKTFAVMGDLQEFFCKTVYAVPLRALGSGIREQIVLLQRNSQPINAVIHHGDQQESVLFSEEVIVTTYDQVVCGVPGLPLSLPLKAGHAVAGALLMSRLILDEAHLAWGISDDALTILLGIIDFRKKFGLQTILLTATLPTEVAKRIGKAFDFEMMILGDNELKDDEGLTLRETNRQVIISPLKLKTIEKTEKKKLDYASLDKCLHQAGNKRIYFANTVERIQETYDRLVTSGMAPDTITVLHNRMPRSQRTQAEMQTKERFGKGSREGDWLLLTNQVAEAGLDISAPLVISDPAPVDTLVQRAGRCARWFRDATVTGEFKVIEGPNDETRKELARPYRPDLVDAACKALPHDLLTWEAERKWVDDTWGGKPKEARDRIERALNETEFALNLFDRAAQQQRPGEIAAVFREILSIDVAVEDVGVDLQSFLDQHKWPETSSVSLSRAWQLLKESKGTAKVIRYEEGDLRVETADYVQPGDILIAPSTLAYLHPKKGLCFGDGTGAIGAIMNSAWTTTPKQVQYLPREGGRRQTLAEHVLGVMQGTYERLSGAGVYNRSLKNILKALEPAKDCDQLAEVIAQIAKLAAGFHDLGKTDWRWQEKARQIDSECRDELIGRTARTETRIGIPHTPPGYLATIKAAELLLGSLGSVEYLIRGIALAAARHHSSLFNPATVDYQYQPHPHALNFVKTVLAEVDAPAHVQSCAQEILDAASIRPRPESIPLLLPNNDLFPIYALVGRAILMADREDASGYTLEQWRSGQS